MSPPIKNGAGIPSEVVQRSVLGSLEAITGHCPNSCAAMPGISKQNALGIM
jgi:hypothetical protein